MDVDAVRAAVARGRRDPRLGSATPTTRPAGSSPTGAIARLLEGLAEDAAADGRPRARGRRRRGVRGVHRPSPCSACASGTPNVVASGPRRKAYALAGLRVGFAVGRPGDDPPHRALPAARARSARSRSTAVDGGAARPGGDARQRRPRRARAAAARSGRSRPPGWRPAALGDQLPARSTSSRRNAPRQRRSALMRRGLVPRTFGHGHPLAHRLRVTVRDPARTTA